MARISGAGTGTPKETAKEKRIREAAEAAARLANGEGSSARRGEQDEPSPSGARPYEAVPHQVSDEDRRVVVPDAVQVVTRSEASEALTYRYLEGASDEEKLAHAQRGITLANRALAEGAAQLQEAHVLTAGRYWHDVVEEEMHKKAGYKSLDQFAAQWGMDRRDVYRLKDAVPVFLALQGLIDEPITERQVRELAVAVRSGGADQARQVWREAKASGRTSSAGIATARKLLAAGGVEELTAPAGKVTPAPAARERLERQRRTFNVEATLPILEEVRTQDPELAAKFVAELGALYEAAAKAVAEG